MMVVYPTSHATSGQWNPKTDPIFQDLKKKVMDAPTLGAKYKIIGVANGFYPQDKVENQRKAVLYLLATNPYFPTDSSGYEGTGENLYSEMAYKGLIGYIDQSLWHWYEVDFGFPTIQEACKTDKTLDDVIAAFAAKDKDAAAQVLLGILAAGKVSKADYGQDLWNRWKTALAENLNPFNNPFTGPFLKAALVFGGLYVAVLLLKSKGTGGGDSKPSEVAK